MLVVRGARRIAVGCARGLTLRLIARWRLLTWLLARRGLLAWLLTWGRLLTGLLPWRRLLAWLLARWRLLTLLLAWRWLSLLLPWGRLTLRRLLSGRLLTLLGRLVLWRLLTGRRLALALSAALALALAFVLVLVLVVLIFVLIRRLLLLELGDFALHEIAVVLAVGIIGFELQRGFVGFDGVCPGFDRILGRGLFRLLAGAVEGVAEIVIRVLLIGEALGIIRGRVGDGLLKRLGCLGKLAGAIGGGTGVIGFNGLAGG